MLLLQISGARCRWWPRPPALPGALWQDGRYRPPPPTRSEGPSCRASSTGGAIEPLLVRAPPHPTTVGRAPKEGCGSRAWWCAVPGDTASPGTTRQHESADLLAVRRTGGWVVFWGECTRVRVLAQAYLVSSFPFWKGETMANFRIPSAVPLLEVREGRERERERRERERESSQ